MKKLFQRFQLNLLPVLSVCVFLFLSAGCQSPGTKVQFRLFPEEIVKKVNSLVRTGKIYRDLDTVFVGNLLRHTPELKKAYIDEMLKKGRMEQMLQRNWNSWALFMLLKKNGMISPPLIQYGNCGLLIGTATLCRL
jgi:hypothetical protein